jgi:hypothetical protein
VGSQAYPAHPVFRCTDTSRPDFHVRFEGIQSFHINWVVENTSIMLHAAIFLFFAGLTEFLFAINDEFADLILVSVSVFAAIYIILTFLPEIRRECPFQPLV